MIEIARVKIANKILNLKLPLTKPLIFANENIG
jgi:hypothetical protein